MSAGPAGGNGGGFTHSLYRTTPDGSHALFVTDEALVADDTDTRQRPVRVHRRGDVRLVSTGTAGGNGAFDLYSSQVYIAEDGDKVIFMTSEQLVSADQDTRPDSYMRTGGTTTTLISPGTGAFPSTMGAISPDADRIFFHTNEPLVPADTDGFMDLYELRSNQVSLISPSPLGGNSSFQPGVSCCPENVVSRNGSRVFFVSGESYAASDTDAASDLYVASTSPTPPPGYARPKGASPLRVPLVPAYQECTAPNREHGPPLAFGSCNPPSQTSSNLTVGTPDANGQAANSIGSVHFAVVAGDPATAPDEADVPTTFSLTDVRVRSTLADYTGNLVSTVTVRITDKLNGTGIEAATVQDLNFSFAVPCAATAGAAGATCQTTTSFDAVMPGAIKEGRRSIWQFDRVRVTQNGQLFATQGIFVP